MSLNLLDSVKNEISSGVIDKISNYLGESRGNTSNAITAAIPSILAFLSEKSKTEKGADNLVSLATDNELSSLFTGNSFKDVFEKNRDSLMAKGNSMLIDLFGNKEAKFSEEISNYANIGKESADGILASVLPLIMSVIGGKVAGGGLNANNLSSLFDGERDAIMGAIPAGLTSLGGILGLGSAASAVSDTTTKVTSNVKNTFDDTKAKAAATADRANPKTFIKEDEKKGGAMKWLLPLLGLIAALVLIWFLMKQCSNDEVTPVDTNDTVLIDSADNDLNVAIPEIRGEYDSINNRFNYELGDEREITLPSGITFTVGEFSTEAQLYDFLNDENSLVSEDKTQGWITLDRIYFETNKANLIDDSKEQLDNLTSILEAYPTVEVKFGGYTDNRGGQDINQPLSQARAESAMKYIVDKGIDGARIDAEGYGQQHFVCPANDTPECMAKNRRTDIRVTKK